MTAPRGVDIDAVRVRAPYTHFADAILALCDELEATRAERERLRAVAVVARSAAEVAPWRGTEWTRLRAALDALEGAE